MTLIDDIYAIAIHAQSPDYDPDRAVLDLLTIQSLIDDAEPPDLDPFERLFLATYGDLRRRGFIDKH